MILSKLAKSPEVGELQWMIISKLNHPLDSWVIAMHPAKIGWKHPEGKHTTYSLYCMIIAKISLHVHKSQYNSSKYISTQTSRYKVQRKKVASTHLDIADHPQPLFSACLAAMHTNSIRPFQKQLTLLSRFLLLPSTEVSQRNAGSTSREIPIEETSSIIFSNKSQINLYL